MSIKSLVYGLKSFEYIKKNGSFSKKYISIKEQVLNDLNCLLYDKSKFYILEK